MCSFTAQGEYSCLAANAKPAEHRSKVEGFFNTPDYLKRRCNPIKISKATPWAISRPTNGYANLPCPLGYTPMV